MTILVDPGPPATVLVTSESWCVVDEPTPRNILLTQLLQEMGGISNTVPPGTYLFNAREIDGLFHAELNPA